MSLIKITVTGGAGAVIGCVLTAAAVFFFMGGVEGVTKRHLCDSVTDTSIELLRGIGE